MKKILKRVATVSCAALFAVSGASCDNQKEIVNAYDIAVKNGFVGTEQEWLNSLKGSNGQDAESISIEETYAAAQKNGYTGSFLDFLKEYLSVDVAENNNTETIADNMMSVVSIYCSFTITTASGFWGATSTEITSSAGSGVIIGLNKEAGNAYIVTNYHVIYNSESNSDTHISDSIYLYTYGALNMYSTKTGKDEDGDGIRATYVGGAMDYDIAILEVSGSEFIQNNDVRVAKIGNSENVKVGEKVYAIGNPDGAGIAVTSGIVSVESEYISMSSTDGANREVSYRVMRTDAAINHGNSGGALFNAQGELIGITNAKNASDDVDNMGYALPITQVKYLCENLMDNDGVVKRAMLGVMVRIIESNAVFENGELSIHEVFIVDTDSDTSETEKNPSSSGSSDSSGKDKDKNLTAADGKLRFGDTFKSITIIHAGESTGQTTTLDRRYQLNDLLLTVRFGDTVILTVVREGVETTETIVYDNENYFTIYK